MKHLWVTAEVTANLGITADDVDKMTLRQLAEIAHSKGYEVHVGEMGQEPDTDKRGVTLEMADEGDHSPMAAT